MSDRRALIFDMDGLMVDSEPLWWRVERAFAEEQGAEWSDELALSCMGKGLPNVIETMNETFGWTLDVNDGASALVDRFIAAVDSLELKPGCRAILEAAVAAERTRAVASSSPHRLINAVLKRFELSDHFHAIVSGEDVTHGKPAPDIFLKTAETLGAAPADCVVFEDSQAGVTAGVAAGMTVIAIPEQAPERFAELTEHVLANLNEARALVGL